MLRKKTLAEAMVNLSKRVSELEKNTAVYVPPPKGFEWWGPSKTSTTGAVIEAILKHLNLRLVHIQCTPESFELQKEKRQGGAK